MSKQLTARSPQTVREHISRDMLFYSGESLSKGHKGALTGYLSKYMGGDENRRLALSWLFSDSQDKAKLMPISSSDLNDAQWFALNRWINASCDEDTGKWSPCRTFTVEAALVLTQAVREYSGLKLSERGALKDADAEPSDLMGAAVNDMGGVITSMLDNDGEIMSSRDVKPPPYVYKKHDKRKDEKLRKISNDDTKIEF